MYCGFSYNLFLKPELGNEFHKNLFAITFSIPRKRQKFDMTYKENVCHRGNIRNCEFLWLKTNATAVFCYCIVKTMVEEQVSSGNKPIKTKTARPKPVYLWSVVDVQKWLRRHCSDYCNLYSDNFLNHEITGRALIRINENTLLRIGIENSIHRREIWREIMKLRLKTDIMEIRDLERQNQTIYFD